MIDYFQQFGNINDLMAILDAWELFKHGEAKLIKKEKVESPILKYILNKYCGVPKKDGTESPSYKLEDKALFCLYEYETYLQDSPSQPITMKQRIQYSMDVLGYADVVTNKEEDRRRLLVTDKTPLSDASGNIWSYRIGTKSLGSGKTARLTVKANVYEKKPIIAGDVIYAAELYKNPSGYWYLLAYNKEI